jgi:biopolymer transport protein ExbD
MAEIADSGGGGGKHAKKGRKSGGTPRIDMTPMVDLAFLLLTFFVLTSNLNKAKTLEMSVPKDKDDTNEPTLIPDELANTVLLDGNKEGILYYYLGKLNDTTKLFELTLDAKKGLRKTISTRNKVVQEQSKFVRDVYKSGKFNKEQHGKILGFVTLATAPGAMDEEVIKKNKAKNFTECKSYLDRDLLKGEMSDTTQKKVRAAISNSDKAPFFIIKWGGAATYGDVINLVDELKIGDVSKYALTTISRVELKALAQKTGRHYPELDEPDPDEAEEIK